MFNKEELKEFVENNPKLVTKKESKRYPGLFVLKYNRRVFYDNLWHVNDILKECRGLVVDSDYNVVVKPFTKVFNYGENGTTIDPDESCTYVRKVNGFMACVTKHNAYDDLIVSTTGSLDSDFVDLAKRHLPLEFLKKDMIAGETFTFEICDSELDPHIIKEEDGAYLIGGYGINYAECNRWSEFALDMYSIMHGLKRFHSDSAKFHEIVENARKCKHEGFMVQGVNGTELKIKSPYYLTVKFIARMNEDKLWNILTKGDIKNSMRNFDEEFYPIIEHISKDVDSFVKLDEQSRIKFIEEYFK